MADEEIAALGIKALKEYIVKHGLSTDGCIDKDDLRSRAKEAYVHAQSAPKAAAAPSNASKTQTFGGYPCIFQAPEDLQNGNGGESQPADILIVTLHGLGATNGDFRDIVSVLQSHDSSGKLRNARIVFVAPQAPMGAMGSSWWNFDVMGFMMAQQARGAEREALIAQLIRKEHPGMDVCRTNMMKLLDETRAIAGGSGGPLPWSKVLLSGFSLGSITALDVALYLGAGETVGGVVVMNGAPVTVDKWAERLQVHKGLRVHVSSGVADMVLPHEATGWIKQLLDGNGAAAKLVTHPGGHEIGGAEVLTSIATFVAATL